MGKFWKNEIPKFLSLNVQCEMILFMNFFMEINSFHLLVSMYLISVIKMIWKNGFKFQIFFC